ncbi:MAG: hypothetical protein Q8P40_05825, partial [Nitrospirota bacterium]|nr:hypothetical protein [Nitrospirota bacterium]
TAPHGRTAFGWVEYDRPLTPEEISGYELFEDEVELPKLVKELVQFAMDEGIDEAMRVIDTEYSRAVWDWLKSQKRIRAGVGQMEQVRAEIVRLAGITEKEKPVEAQPAAKPKIEPKVTDTQAIYKRAKEVAEWWFNSQMKNPFTEFYLYHKVGDFRVAIETPEGYKLSDAQRISPAWTKEQAEQWIFDKVQRLPILPLMPVTPLPLYSPRAEPTYKEIIRTQQIKGWTVKYKFEWKSAMGYYSGFIWVNRGIGEGIRTAIINITSPEEIPKEVEKAIAEAEKVTQKPMLEPAELLYKRYTSGYSTVSLIGIARQDTKNLAHSIGYELKLDTAIYTPAVLLQYAEKFKEFAQRDYDKEHKKHEARKEKEQAEKEKEKREGGQAFWDEVKNLKVVDYEVQHDINPDKGRGYYHVYDRTFAILENGKKVQISYVINKGEYGKRAAKATKEYYEKFYNQYMGKPLSYWVSEYHEDFIRTNMQNYKAQQPKPRVTFIPEAQPKAAEKSPLTEKVLERFPTKEYLEPKIREYGKWIRENTYGEAGVRRLQTGSYEEVIATIKEFIRKYYNLTPAPADYIFRRPAYQQTEIGIDSLATTFFNVAANGWDLAKTFKEWEAGETRQEWDRRLKELEKPQIVKPVVKPEERILGELRTKYRFSRPEGDMVAKAIDSYIKIRDKSAVLAILTPVRDGKFIADDLIEMVEGRYWLKKEVPVPQPQVIKPIETIQETKQKLLQRIQSAGTVIELQAVLKDIGAANLPEHEKQQLLDMYQNRFSMLKSEAVEKPKILGGPSKQELWEEELRKKAEEGKRLRGQVTIGGAVSTAARLGLFEPGAMEKAKAEAEARRRIEQLGLPYMIHPVIKKLAESKEYILKFGAVTGKETLEDTILSRYKSYCPAGVIVDNKSAKGQHERWWVYPERLRNCLTEVQQKIAAAMTPAGVAMVKEAVRALTPSMRQYIQGARAVRDVIHYFRDGSPPVRGVAFRARDGTYFVEAQDGQIYASMGWEDVYGAGMPAARAGAVCR